jgi:hypothetical protein
MKAGLPVIVIGAGPVGLAAAAHLLENGLTPLLLEAGPRVGEAARSRRGRIPPPYQRSAAQRPRRECQMTLERRDNGGMNIELRTIPGCPHGASAAELFARALKLEGMKPAVLAVREIDTNDAAATFGFHGSPSFIIDGRDLFPLDTEPAVTCRVYPTSAGLAGQPELETLRGAIRVALRASPGTAS